MKQELEQAVAAAIKSLFDTDATVDLTRPDEQFGDYATNVALQLAGKLGKSPREIAEQLVAELRTNQLVRDASAAGPGFVNITVNDTLLLEQLDMMADSGYGKSDSYEGQVIVAEYSDPNPFKVLHAGHLYTSVVGDAIANLLEAAGGEVHRVNYGGDVGLHVAKNMWAIVQFLDGENPQKLDEIPENEKAEWLSARYMEGNRAYEESETGKSEIIEFNKRIYGLHNDDDHDSPLARIYWTTRTWSYQYFDQFYARLGISFEKYYPESETTPLGLATVRDHVGDTYEESDGAIVFRGEKYGLHTRVFINSAGLPTYEAKEVGLLEAKWRDYHFDSSVYITGNEIAEYMKVVLKSVEQFQPDLVNNVVHLTHGHVKLSGGVKMSSRKGNILRAVDVLDAAAEANKQATGKDDEQVTLGAVKYAFLKQRMGGDIVYDPDESVALQGNSGVYLQYAAVRAKSILKQKPEPTLPADWQPDAGERTLLRKMTEYPEATTKAVNELAPHVVSTYLYELAQTFNRFYENNRVIGDVREPQRLRLVTAYGAILQNGLGLLGIHAPDQM